MALEKRTKGALLLTHEDGWSLRIEPGDDLVLGRAPDTAAPIPHLATDRRHARVRHSGTSCTIEDLGSTSGTYLNDHLVQKPESISSGDVIRIGPFQVVVSMG